MSSELNEDGAKIGVVSVLSVDPEYVIAAEEGHGFVIMTKITITPDEPTDVEIVYVANDVTYAKHYSPSDTIEVLADVH